MSPNGCNPCLRSKHAARMGHPLCHASCATGGMLHACVGMFHAPQPIMATRPWTMPHSHSHVGCVPDAPIWGRVCDWRARWLSPGCPILRLFGGGRGTDLGTQAIRGRECHHASNPFPTLAAQGWGTPRGPLWVDAMNWMVRTAGPTIFESAVGKERNEECDENVCDNWRSIDIVACSAVHCHLLRQSRQF